MKLRKHKLNEVDNIDSKLLTVMKMVGYLLNVITWCDIALLFVD